VDLNPASSSSNFRRLTDSKYSIEEKVHRGVVIRDYQRSSSLPLGGKFNLVVPEKE
jgi:hypothetical protein